VLNPPLVGVLLGVAVGATPLSAIVIPGVAESAGAALRPPPLELALFAAAARCCADAAALLGDAALPVDTLVLATALSPPMQAPARGPAEIVVNAEPMIAAACWPAATPRRRCLRAARAARRRRRSCGRLLLPAARADLLPADPVLRLVLLAQSAMSSAQNLVLLLALRRGTAAAAPRLAAQLMRQYAAAALPVAAWLSLFVRIVQ
jgi:hypothetical protein